MRKGTGEPEGKRNSKNGEKKIVCRPGGRKQTKRGGGGGRKPCTRRRFFVHEKRKLGGVAQELETRTKITKEGVKG